MLSPFYIQNEEGLDAAALTALTIQGPGVPGLINFFTRLWPVVLVAGDVGGRQHRHTLHCTLYSHIRYT